MNILTKILKNNEDKIEIKFLVFDTFFLLNAHKIGKFENKFANQHKLYSYTVVLWRYKMSAI